MKSQVDFCPCLLFLNFSSPPHLSCAFHSLRSDPSIMCKKMLLFPSNNDTTCHHHATFKEKAEVKGITVCCILRKKRFTASLHANGLVCSAGLTWHLVRNSTSLPCFNFCQCNEMLQDVEGKGNSQTSLLPQRSVQQDEISPHSLSLP